MADLSREELEAIQDAVQQRRPKAPPARNGRARTPEIDPEDVGPLALIADDQRAESARPCGLRVAERWTRVAKSRLRRQLPGEYSINATAASIIDGPTVADELKPMWKWTVSPGGGRGAALLAIGGPMIESIAARLCGDDEPETSPDRPPSTTALGIFQPIGVAFADALAIAWSEEQGCKARASGHPNLIDRTLKSVSEADVVIAVTVQVAGVLTGTIRLLALPATLVPPPPAIEAVPASRAEIEAALGQVPVEVRVDLGHAAMTIAELGKLAVGAVITLSSFVDDPLPIRCGEVVKAFGRPVVARGFLAVEVDRVALPGTAKE